MSSKLGVNLRVTQWGNQGGRAYMEDRYAVHFEKTNFGMIEFAYFGIFDGHGGSHAAKFARDNLLAEITKYDEFWTDDDKGICECIKAGFLDTHNAMWKEIDTWPRTQSGFASTSGTTASICIIKNLKMYVGHVGDSAIVLGQKSNKPGEFIASQLTTDHKPESPKELARIEKSGGAVQAKSGIQRVVWNRPKRDHHGPIRRSTPIDRIPFLAVARSLGDLWSYNYTHKEFAVSPEPDVTIHHIDPASARIIVLGSDGLWNMTTAAESIQFIADGETKLDEKIVESDLPATYTENSAMKLVFNALTKWMNRKVKADNVSAVVVHIQPYDYHRGFELQMAKKRHREALQRAKPQIKFTPLVCDVVYNEAFNRQHPGGLTPPSDQKVRSIQPVKSLSDCNLLKEMLNDDSYNDGTTNGEKLLYALNSDEDIPYIGEDFVVIDKNLVKDFNVKDFNENGKYLYKQFNGTIVDPPKPKVIAPSTSDGESDSSWSDVVPLIAHTKNTTKKRSNSTPCFYTPIHETLSASVCTEPNTSTASVSPKTSTASVSPKTSTVSPKTSTVSQKSSTASVSPKSATAADLQMTAANVACNSLIKTTASNIPSTSSASNHPGTSSATSCPNISSSSDIASTSTILDHANTSTSMSSFAEGNTSTNESIVDMEVDTDSEMYPTIEGKRVVVIERDPKGWDDINLMKDRVANCCFFTKSNTKLVRDYLLKKPGNNVTLDNSFRHGTVTQFRHTTNGYEFANCKTADSSIAVQHKKLKSVMCVEEVESMNTCITKQLTTLNPFYKLKRRQSLVDGELMRINGTVPRATGPIKRSISGPSTHDLKHLNEPGKIMYARARDINHPSERKAPKVGMWNRHPELFSNPNMGRGKVMYATPREINKPTTALKQPPNKVNQVNNTPCGIVLRSRNKISPVKTTIVKSSPKCSTAATVIVDKEQIGVDESRVRHNLRYTPRRNSLDTVNCVPSSRMVRRLRSALKRKSTRSPARIGNVKRLKKSYNMHSR